MSVQPKPSIRAQLMRMNLIIVIVSIALSTVGTLYFTLRGAQTALDNNLLNSASILSLLFDTEGKVQLVMDRETYEQDYLSCHPCKSTGTLKLRMRDVLEVFLPRTGHAPTVVELPKY